MGAIFAQFGGGEIDNYFLSWEVEERVAKGGTDTVATFVDDFTSKSYDIKTRQAARVVAFDCNKAASVAMGNSRIYF